MNCCGSGSHEPKQNNTPATENKTSNSNGTLVWILGLALIVVLAYLLFK